MLPIYASDKSIRLKDSFRLKDKLKGWLRLILSDTNSRNLFFFLLLNFSFAFVELFYGFWTNSLGLISDSFHMFFDCTALIAGLIASIVTKWRSDNKFTYGYVRAEILAGFVNGLFLVFVAFFIFKEAIERALEPPEVKHERLFIISVLGLIVNLVGIFVFQHGGSHHGHSHGSSESGHSHHSHDTAMNNHQDHLHDNSHSHSHNETNSHIANPYASANSADPYNYANGQNSQSHQHSHSHNSENALSNNSHIMKGVFLHILADTLGSVGVIISALLMSQFGWMIADPICSMFIAFMVLISVYPLLRDSSAILMQRSPIELDTVLPNCFRKVMEIEGVISIQEPHFWTLCSNSYVGTLKIEVNSRIDPRYILSHTHNIFNQIGVKSLFVQFDYVQM